MAWACWLLALIFTALNLWLLSRNVRTEQPAGLASTPVEVVTALAYAAVTAIGTAVIVRRRDNGAGWAFLVAGLTLAVSAFISEYTIYGVLTDPGSLPAVRWVTWLGAWGWWAGACLGLTFGLMLYPDGALPSPRWRWAARVAAANLGLLILLHALTPGPLDGEYSPVVNPFGIGGGAFLRPLRDVAWLLVMVNALIAATSLLVRARRTSAERRLQLLWLVAPALTAAVAAPVWGITAGGERRPSSGVQALVLLGVFGTPLAVGSALAHAASLRRSVSRLVLAQEEERRRIRRDLHDGLGPALAGVALQLDVAREIVHRDPQRAEVVLDGLTGQVQAAIGDIRRLVDNLRPQSLDQLGLVSAIRESTSHLSRGHGESDLAVVVEATGDMGLLPPATEVSAFRIVMEAVTNAARHGMASRCRVLLAVDEALELRVEDDGRGIADDDVPGVGLGSMRERAAELGGTCVIERGPAGGTIVRARLPIGMRP